MSSNGAGAFVEATTEAWCVPRSVCKPWLFSCTAVMYVSYIQCGGSFILLLWLCGESHTPTRACKCVDTRAHTHTTHSCSLTPLYSGTTHTFTRRSSPTGCSTTLTHLVPCIVLVSTLWWVLLSQLDHLVSQMRSCTCYYVCVCICTNCLSHK